MTHLCRAVVILAAILSIGHGAEQTPTLPKSGSTSTRLQLASKQSAKPTANLGLNVANAKFSSFGTYLQRMMEAVQAEWNGLLVKTPKRPPAGTYVTVHFTLKPSGAVVRFGSIDSTTDELGVRIATSAIMNTSPFGPWTEDMKRTLNSEEELRLTFYYP